MCCAFQDCGRGNESASAPGMRQENGHWICAVCWWGHPDRQPAKPEKPKKKTRVRRDGTEMFTGFDRARQLTPGSAATLYRDQ